MNAPARLSLPPVLSAIAEVAGEEAALAIAQARGGTQVYLPPDPAPDHWISLLVGHEAAKAIVDKLNGGIPVGRRVDVPLGPTGYAARQKARIDAIIDGMLAENRSERDIALATGYTIRTIRRRRAKIDDRQFDLF